MPDETVEKKFNVPIFLIDSDSLINQAFMPFCCINSKAEIVSANSLFNQYFPHKSEQLSELHSFISSSLLLQNPTEQAQTFVVPGISFASGYNLNTNFTLLLVRPYPSSDVQYKLVFIPQMANAEQLQTSLDAGVNFERLRLTQYIHDHFGQNLAALNFLFQSFDKLPTLANKEQLSSAKQIVDELVSRYRNFLSPDEDQEAPIDIISLFRAKAAIIEKLYAIDVKVESSENELLISNPLAKDLYLVIEELFNNVIKHAGASEIRIIIKFQVHHILCIQFSDNGVGMFVKQGTGNTGFGISGIRSRIALWAGQVEWKKGPEHGTCVTFSIPVKN